MFDGATFDPNRDEGRLRAQLERIATHLSDGAEHYLPEIEAATGDPQASISARIRDLRKKKFGGHTVISRYVSRGLWGYRLVLGHAPGTWGRSKDLIEQRRQSYGTVIHLRERRRRRGH